jgi:hypothetical protein
MGLGSRLRNLFSPKRSGRQRSGDRDDDDDSPSSAVGGGEQITFSEDPPSNSSTTATATTANGDATNPQNNISCTTPSSASAGTKVAAAKQSSSSSKNKGHCNYPGCTRALFARGKCYRHDHEMRSGKKSSRSTPANDDDKTSNGGRKPNGQKKSAKKNNHVNGETPTSSGKKKKREEDIQDTKPPAVAAAATKKPESVKTSPKKKGHCSHPGCTRALFARGKCYRHDQGTNNNKSGSTKSTTTPKNNGDEKMPSSSDDKKQRSASTDRKNNGVVSAATSRPGSVGEGKKKMASKATEEATTSVTDMKPAAASKQPEAVKSTSPKKGHCRYPGCTRALFARGHCYRHDQETKRSGNKVSPAANAINTPSNDSSAISSSAGKKRKSDVVKSTPKSASSSTTTKKKAKMVKSSSSGSKHCSYPGCTRALFARGMCYRHDTETKRSGGSTTTPSPPKSMKKKKKKVVASSSSSEEQQSLSARKKKGHCNYPGCTRALFARGKCYRHDQEVKSGNKKSSTRSSGSKNGMASSSSVAAATSKKSNAKSAVPILPSLTKALTSSSQQSPRKSAIARRPRQLKPTDKLLAMQEDALALIALANSGGGKKKRKSEKIMMSAATTTSGVGNIIQSGDKWECTRCTTINPPSRNRCTSCQGWRGGKREGFSPPNKKMRVGRSSEGGVSLEELTANTTYDDEEESNYDNVVCCLCKCGVDFSDADFFLPEGHGEQCEQPEGINVESSSSLEGEDNLDESNGKAKGNLKSEGLEDDDYLGESNGKLKGNLKSEGLDDLVESKDDDGKDDKSSKDDGTADDDEEKPPFQLPRRFYNFRNGLILCDGPAHAGKRRGSSSNGQQRYQCERAYHQRCHFIPVFSVPRGPWRCLICRYRDEQYLRKKGNVMDDSDARIFTDQELNDMFRCDMPQPKDETGVDEEEEVDEEKKEKAVITNVPPAMKSPSKSDIASLEHEFENVTGPLKAKIIKEDLTTKAEKVINAALSNIRNSEHSLRSFTETSRSRKALAERIQCIGGLPQELTQCVMRIAQNKLRIKDLIVVLEESIRCAPHHVNSKSEVASGCIDAVSELMQWYMSQSSPEEAAHCNPDQMQAGKTLLQHLFPEGDLHRRRFEPRTGEARVEAEDDASVKSDSSGVSLDDLKCSCCHGGAATDDNDMLLCDGIGCYRAFHMQCLEPKVTLEEVEAGEDEAWFCPLCTAHANLVHYAQREYLLDDWEHDWDEIMRRRGHSEWETADDVFPEAELELRVAQKFKDGIKDEETAVFIAETFGIGAATAELESDVVDEDAIGAHDDDDDDEEDDEDFDVDGRVEGGSDDDSSAAEDMNEEKKLLKEKIGRDELDALSDYSSSEESDSDASSDEDKRLRRSKRRRFTFPPAAAKGGASSGDDQSSDRSKPTDMGALDTKNIVMGKRNRSRVDYRKLADTMFGDDSDEEAKGSVMKYDYKPKKAPVDESSDEDDESSDESDGDEEEEESQSGE